MDELMKTLCEAYDLLKNIPVRGADVDAMFIVRQKMQSAYNIANEMKNAEKEVKPDES